MSFNIRIKLFILRMLRPILKTIMHFKFDEQKYKNHFITKYPKLVTRLDTKAPEIIFGFWTGENEITPNRKRCIKSIEEFAGIPFKLITPDNINNYVSAHNPLHPAYEYLSMVHRSDYLRCYFMHHHGGGYIDIKEIDTSWSKAFNKLNALQDKWIIGYPELAPSMIPHQDGKFGRDLKKNYFRIIGNAGFIFKPKSPFSKEWLTLVEEILSKNFDLLKKNPGNIYGNNIGYPLKWAEIQGNIFHPLCLKYQEYILQDKDLTMSFKDYR